MTAILSDRLDPKSGVVLESAARLLEVALNIAVTVVCVSVHASKRAAVLTRNATRTITDHEISHRPETTDAIPVRLEWLTSTISTGQIASRGITLVAADVTARLPLGSAIAP